MLCLVLLCLLLFWQEKAPWIFEGFTQQIHLVESVKIHLFTIATTCYTGVWRREEAASCGRHQRKAQQWSRESIQISMSLARRTCQWASGYRFVRGRKNSCSHNSCKSPPAAPARQAAVEQRLQSKYACCSVAVSQPSPSLPPARPLLVHFHTKKNPNKPIATRERPLNLRRSQHFFPVCVCAVMRFPPHPLELWNHSRYIWIVRKLLRVPRN